MKVVLSGATGFIGSHVLARLVADDDVTRVTCLTRRPVDSASPKVEALVVDDFTRYPDALVTRLADHVGVVWALGGKDSDVADPELYTRITHGFTLAFATAVASATDRFTFCYVSGAGADPTETARLPWQRLTRRVKGRTERDLRALAATTPGLAVHCFRSAGVLPPDTSRALALAAAPVSVRADRLADALVDVVTGRVTDAPSVVSNGAIRRLAGRSTPSAGETRA